MDRVQVDGRTRNTLLWHGAGTGRWTARGIQLQNLPSKNLAIPSHEVPDAINAAKAGALASLYTNPMDVAKACIRGMVIPAPGKQLYCADYSAIEGRLLAWLAGEEHVVQAYRDGKRMYCVAAADMYGVPYDLIYAGRKTEPQFMKMDAVGKVNELACGYAGSVQAVRKMERQQGLDLGFTDAQVKEKVKAWREGRPMTVRYWAGLEEACFQAVEQPGVITEFKGIKFKVVGKFLMMLLLSGRRLYYFDPKIEPNLMPWKDYKTGEPVWKDCVSFWAVDSQTKKWCKSFMYGGLLTNNVVQGLARDIMASAMLRLDAAGYTPVLTVHDEVLSESPIGFGSLDEFLSIMTILDEWATGFPIAAAGHVGNRYKKD